MKVTALIVCLLFSACQEISSLNALKFDGGQHDASPQKSSSNSAMSVSADAAAGEGCRVAEGDECDVVRRCGCADDESCLIAGKEQRARCSQAGSQDPWTACTVATQCPVGQTCDRGSCRPYCESDSDCGEDKCLPARGPDTAVSEKIGVCWKRCEKVGSDEGCADGTRCRNVTTPLGEKSTFCVAPLDPCPTVEDGVCNEPEHGDGSCAKRTDALDCGCSPPFKVGKCDPVAQCGCDADQTCVAVLDEDEVKGWSSQCIKAGSTAEGEPCMDRSDCAPGLYCNAAASTCIRYCSKDEDCGDGACVYSMVGDRATVGYCASACRRDDKTSSCRGSEVCAKLDATRYFFAANKLITKSGNFCFTPFSAEYCLKDKICDDPSGTGVCTEGSDANDCCAPPGEGPCNPFRQCGCDSGRQCQITDLYNATACSPQGKLPKGSVCTSNIEQCEPGSMCFENVCRPYCRDLNDCGGGENMCLKFWEKDLSTSPSEYGICAYACDPAASSCAAGTECARLDVAGSFICLVPSFTCVGINASNNACDDTRPGGSRRCQLGSDPDCCAIDEGSECNAEARCGCELKPGTECRKRADSAMPTCQPIHAEPLSSSCSNVSDPSCCSPRFGGSECDPVAQCGCESKPGTQCQTLGASGIAGCMPVGNLPLGSLCASQVGQCAPGSGCDWLHGVCRKYCNTEEDCWVEGATAANSHCYARDNEQGLCLRVCDFETEEPCSAGTRCAQYVDDLAICMSPYLNCPNIDNQRCDDTRPGGTRVCAYGTDPECN